MIWSHISNDIDTTFTLFTSNSTKRYFYSHKGYRSSNLSSFANFVS